MSLSRILSGEAQPLQPAGQNAEMDRYIRELHIYLRRLFGFFTTELIAGEALPAGAAGSILYHNGTSWTTLSKPGSDGTFFLKCEVTSGTPVISWQEAHSCS